LLELLETVLGIAGTGIALGHSQAEDRIDGTGL
jgi:hypothetical protein